MCEKWIYIKLLGHSGQDRGINIMAIILVVQTFQGFFCPRKTRAVHFVTNSQVLLQV